MSEFYTKAQSDAQAAVVGARIKNRTSPSFIDTQIAAINDKNLVSDADLLAIANIPPVKYKGAYPSIAALTAAHPTAVSGDNATLTKTGEDDTNAIWDEDSGVWIDTGAAVTAETPTTIIAKLNSVANANLMSDAQEAKLDGIVDATDITDYTAALDGAINS